MSQTTKSKYTLETLLGMNVMYDAEHTLTQEDVDMVNSLVETIEKSRSAYIPQIGDRAIYVERNGDYYGNALIEKKRGDKLGVCLDPYVPFVWKQEPSIGVNVSGGPFKHVGSGEWKLEGWTEGDFKEWGHCGPRANGTVRFSARVPLWSYSEPDPLYGDFTTRTWRKVCLNKRSGCKEGSLYQGDGIAFHSEEEFYEYVCDHEGTTFPGIWPTQIVLWCFNHENRYLLPADWHELNADATERRFSGSPEQVKIVKDIEKHTTIFYHIRHENTNQ